MSDDERGKPPNNFDLTTPNVPPQYGGGHAQPPQPGAGGFDRTTINNPAQQQPGRGSPPPPQQNPTQNRFDLTTVNVGTPYAEDSQQQRPPYPPQQPQYPPQQQQYPQPPQYAPAPQPPQARAKRRGIPWWGWLAGVVLLLFLAGAGVGLYFWLMPKAPFTLRVEGLPPGAKLFVDDVPSGVPQRDGTITKQGLAASRPHDVRITCEGFAEYRETVEGESGQVRKIAPKLMPVKPTLQQEIDYNGAMVLVNAGQFTMGTDAPSSPTGDEQHAARANERPAHPITLPDFYIDKYEVTNEQYARFCQVTHHPVPADPDAIPNYFRDNPRAPVMGVSFDDASAYATWAGKRLPTEEEWEKAASWDPNANQKRRWPWGDEPDPSRANVGSRRPVDVGRYPAGASPYGAQDMAGNVVEWVDAVLAPYPSGPTATDPDYGRNLRVFRGGSFLLDVTWATTTIRLGREATYKTTADHKSKDSAIGFRCAVLANDPKLKAHLQQTR